MTESKTLLQLIQSQLDEFCHDRRGEFEAISPDLVPMIDFAKSLMAGGKRFRAMFAYWAWMASLPTAEYQQTEEQRVLSAEAIVSITTALEMFHALER